MQRIPGRNAITSKQTRHAIDVIDVIDGELLVTWGGCQEVCLGALELHMQIGGLDFV